MLELPRKEIGRFEEFTLPNGEAVYKEQRGDKHYYHAEIKPSKSATGGYSFIKGTTLTGVSTASKYLNGDPGGLMHWAAERDQDGVARIAAADMDAGLSLHWLRTQESISARLHEEEATWEHERDRRADQGTNVHKETVWKLATGQEATLADVSDVERGFSQGVFRSFQALGLRGKVKHAEQVTVAHDKRIAGTFDVWAEGVETARVLACLKNPEKVPDEVKRLESLRLLADYKTRDGVGKIRISDHVQLQGYEDCNRACGIGPSDGQVVIIVLPDGSYEIFWCIATYGQWVAALNGCHSGKQVGREVEAMARAAKKAKALVAA
jgi:hypothetical protein